MCCLAAIQPSIRPMLIHCSPTTSHTLYCSGDWVVSCRPGTRKIFSRVSSSTYGEYSPDSSHIITNSYNACNVYTYDPQEGISYQYELKTESGKSTTPRRHFSPFACHPNNTIVAFISHDNTLEYWNYKNRTRKAIMTFPHSIEHNHYYKKLSFSPNGAKLLIAFKNGWHILPVPFNALYAPEVTRTSIISLLTLMNSDTFDVIPIELRYLIISLLIQTYTYR